MLDFSVSKVHEGTDESSVYLFVMKVINYCSSILQLCYEDFYLLGYTCNAVQ
jgi:hypothetical protein